MTTETAPAILGSGALGRWLAWQLRTLDPVLVGRRLPDPVRLCWPDGRTVVWRPRFRRWDQAWPAAPPWIVVAVKWAGLGAVREWLSRWSIPPPLLTVMNGMGQEEALAGVAGAAPAWLNVGVTTAGCTRLPDDSVLVAAEGETVFADGATWQAVRDTARSLGLPWRFEQPDAVWRLRWIKLGQNAVINPLSGLTGLVNGELPASPLWRLAPAILEEWALAAARAGVHAGDGRQMLARVEALCRQTAGNRSSLWQDLQRRQPTEIEAINGYVVRMLARESRPAPVNQALCTLIHVLESAAGDR